MSKTSVGSEGETLACKYLHKLGYKIIDRNFRIRGGEIDIVALHKGEIVFVEVKCRYSHDFGLPSDSITPFKIKSLQKTALFFLQKLNWGDKPYRFDFVSVDNTSSDCKPKIDLIQNIIN